MHVQRPQVGIFIGLRTHIPGKPPRHGVPYELFHVMTPVVIGVDSPSDCPEEGLFGKIIELEACSLA